MRKPYAVSRQILEHGRYYHEAFQNERILISPVALVMQFKLCMVKVLPTQFLVYTPFFDVMVLP